MKVFQRVHDGVKGQVLDENENPVRHAKLKVWLITSNFRL